MDDTILLEYQPTGASPTTASQDRVAPGVAGSRRMAETDLSRVSALRARLQAAARKSGIPSALLAALASRESRCGAALDANGWGDRGNAFGILQIDKRHHEIEGLPDPASQAHIDQAAAILASNLLDIQAKHSPWPRARQLQGAVAAYNCGIGNVRTLDGMDRGTTGGDYSNDVWARARFYREKNV